MWRISVTVWRDGKQRKREMMEKKQAEERVNKGKMDYIPQGSSSNSRGSGEVKRDHTRILR
jgi:hypothetical protein